MSYNSIWTHIKKPASWMTGGIIFINIAGGFFDHDVLHREDPHIHPETSQTQTVKPAASTNASSVSSAGFMSGVSVINIKTDR